MIRSDAVSAARSAAGIGPRLLAEAIRAVETSACGVSTITTAEGALAGERHVDPERALIERAMAHREAAPLASALERVGRLVRVVVLLGMVIPLLAGGLAARAAIVGSTANVFGLLGGLLGVQLVFLVVWAAAMIATRRAGGMIGRTMIDIALHLVRRVLHARHELAAAQALGAVMATPAVGRWSVSLVTHLAWASFNVGALVALALMFLGEGYQFRWDSTWLSAESYAWLIHAVGAIPEMLGFPTPNAEQIASSRSVAGGSASQDELTRAAWSWLFFGCVVTYGLVPRLLLAGVSQFLRCRARAGYRLDLDHPYYASLLRSWRNSWAPAVHDAPPPDEMADDAMATTGTRAASPGSAVALLGFETRPESWPPLPDGLDLGLVDDRAALREAITRASGRATPVGRLLLFVEMRSSPDRGARGVLDLIARALPESEVWLILTGGRRYGEQTTPDAVARRVQGWRRITREAGLDADRVVELDLDHLTDSTRAALRSIAREGRFIPQSDRRLERALLLIREVASGWPDRVDWQDQVALFQRIDAVYGHQSTRMNGSWWRDAAARLTEVRAPSDAVGLIGEAARRVVDRLPPSLRLRPTWLAAGAVAGAVGCLAAALMLSPAAVGALPLWSGLGAAAAGVMTTLTRHDHPAPEPPDDRGAGRETAIRAAALHALVLELQGRPEHVIAAILERVMPGDEAALGDAQAIRRWLDDVRHRFDLALASEGAA